MAQPTSVLSPPLLPASLAIYTTVALVAFEGLAVAAALPQVTADLGGVELLPWVISAYLLAAGVATVVAGPLVDALGTRRMFRWASGVFVATSVGAAVAPSMPLLIAARLLQGVGGGLILAVAIAAVSLVYPDHLVGRAFAANSTVWGVMGVAGPALAALLLTVASWRWIFAVNLPLGGLAMVAGWSVLPDAQDDAEPATRDLVGVLLVAAFTTFTLVAVSELGLASAGWMAAAVLAAALYWRRTRRRQRPVLRLEHVAAQPYLGLGLGIALLLAGAIGPNSYLPLYAQGGRAATAATAAWSVLFITVGWTTGANIAGRISDRIAESSLMLFGFSLTLPTTVAAAAAVAVDGPLWLIFGVFFVMGLGIGIATNAGLTLLRALTPRAQMGRASAAHAFIRNQGITYGVAAAGAILLLVVARQVGDVETVREVLAGQEAELGGATREAISSGFAASLFTGAGLVGLGLVPVVALRKHLAEARAARKAARQQEG